MAIHNPAEDGRGVVTGLSYASQWSAAGVDPKNCPILNGNGDY
jgi:hypothetical protein